MNTNEMFEEIFKCRAEPKKLQVLEDEFGIEKLNSVLRYYLINGAKPPGTGKRVNPYGLLYKVCGAWKI